MRRLTENKVFEQNINETLSNVVPAAPPARAHEKNQPVPQSIVARLEKVERVETLEIMERDDVVIIDGVTNKDNKPIDEAICDELNAYTNLNVVPSEFTKCTYIGPPKPNDNTPRSIRVKL